MLQASVRPTSAVGKATHLPEIINASVNSVTIGPLDFDINSFSKERSKVTNSYRFA